MYNEGQSENNVNENLLKLDTLPKSFAELAEITVMLLQTFYQTVDRSNL